MAKWINRSVVAAPRNGTTSHTVAFTPAASESLLVAVMYGSVTSTTPAGWTLPPGGSAINNGGMYVWHKTATAGESSLTTVHNGSNYPVIMAVYEFPAGSALVTAASSVNNPDSSSGPTLSGLTGTNLLVGIAASSVNGSVWPFTWTSPTGIVKDIDQGVPADVTDGYSFSLAYLEDSPASTWNPASTTSGVASERITLAVHVAPASSSYAGSAALSGTGGLSAAAGAALAVAVSLSGAGSLAGAGAPAITQAAALGGRGALTATGAATSAAAVSVSLSGAGSLTAKATGPVGPARDITLTVGAPSGHPLTIRAPEAT